MFIGPVEKCILCVCSQRVKKPPPPTSHPPPYTLHGVVVPIIWVGGGATQ